MTLETRIAFIGVVGALAGTLVGGLVTYAVTQEQINSQREESRRSQRLDAYSKYFGDAARLWTQVFAIMEGGARPKTLSAPARSDLASLEETVTGEFALVVLLAPPRVGIVANELNDLNIDVWNALNSGRIDVKSYLSAKRKILGEHSPLTGFEVASRADLGTAGG